MEKVIGDFLQNYTGGLLLLGMLILIVCAVVQLHKIKKLSRKIGRVVKAVEEYLAVVMGDEDSAEAEQLPQTEATTETLTRNSEKEDKQEEQSRLVSAVLQEIFP
jgi:Sec-independent protein translocase protein TatA